jgi:hypothetical protein
MGDVFPGVFLSGDELIRFIFRAFPGTAWKFTLFSPQYKNIIEKGKMRPASQNPAFIRNCYSCIRSFSITRQFLCGIVTGRAGGYTPIHGNT